jgi:hypothetical protein
MGFLAKMGAAWKLGQSAEFIQKYLEVENVTGMYKGDPKRTSEKLVLALWADHPELTGKPMLVAAGALANGIKHFDSSGDRAVADAFFRCLKNLLQHDVQRTMDVTMLRGPDKQLADMAYAAFDS